MFAQMVSIACSYRLDDDEQRYRIGRALAKEPYQRLVCGPLRGEALAEVCGPDPGDRLVIINVRSVANIHAMLTVPAKRNELAGSVRERIASALGVEASAVHLLRGGAEVALGAPLVRSRPRRSPFASPQQAADPPGRMRQAGLPAQAPEEIELGIVIDQDQLHLDQDIMKSTFGYLLNRGKARHSIDVLATKLPTKLRFSIQEHILSFLIC
jgi:hypothetical protein